MQHSLKLSQLSAPVVSRPSVPKLTTQMLSYPVLRNAYVSRRPLDLRNVRYRRLAWIGSSQWKGCFGSRADTLRLPYS